LTTSPAGAARARPPSSRGYPARGSRDDAESCTRRREGIQMGASRLLRRGAAAPWAGARRSAGRCPADFRRGGRIRARGATASEESVDTSAHLVFDRRCQRKTMCYGAPDMKLGCPVRHRRSRRPWSWIAGHRRGVAHPGPDRQCRLARSAAVVLFHIIPNAVLGGRMAHLAGPTTPRPGWVLT